MNIIVRVLIKKISLLLNQTRQQEKVPTFLTVFIKNMFSGIHLEHFFRYTYLIN